jgi:hypothetical protein
VLAKITQLETARSCANAPAPPLYSELVPSEESAAQVTAGLRLTKAVTSATLLEAVAVHERDDATRLAQRCTPQPHARSRWTTHT